MVLIETDRGIAAVSPQPAPPPRNSYYPQLDALRALAVAGVAWHHWLPEFTFGLPFDAGVQLFFVLSGFLITGILLDAREQNESSAAEPKSGILRSFYARRALRIFPLFYLVLVIATLLNISNLRITYPWHFLYASNFYFIYNQAWDGPISHFWTLAVEEQFYLLWPFVILFTPQRILPTCLCLFALSAPVYRLVGAIAFPGVQLWDYATIGSFDSLAVGAILAYAQRYAPALWEWISRRRWTIGVVSVAAYGAIAFTPALHRLSWLKLTLLSIAFCVTVVAASQGVSGAIGRLLSSRVLRYLGTISYGLYILHNFAVVPLVLTYRYVPVLQSVPGSAPVVMAFWTILVAAISWRYFERPINRLKKRFPYHREPSAVIA